jgi:hypothetical protein
MPGGSSSRPFLFTRRSAKVVNRRRKLPEKDSNLLPASLHRRRYFLISPMSPSRSSGASGGSPNATGSSSIVKWTRSAAKYCKMRNSWWRLKSAFVNANPLRVPSMSLLTFRPLPDRDLRVRLPLRRPYPQSLRCRLTFELPPRVAHQMGPPSARPGPEGPDDRCLLRPRRGHAEIIAVHEQSLVRCVRAKW